MSKKANEASNKICRSQASEGIPNKLKILFIFCLQFKLMNRLPVLLIPIFIWTQLPAAVIYVNQSATGVHTGESWENAFTDLQSALAVAQPFDEIWIAKGTYKPTSGSDRSATFLISNGIRLYGGFLGMENNLQQRAPITNQTILSGDIGSELELSDNVFHVITISNSPDQAVLDGISIIFGFADQTIDGAGGGIFIDGTSQASRIDLLISNCYLEENYAGLGGGIGILATGGEVRLQSSYTNYRYNLADAYLSFNRSGGGGIGILASDGVADIQLDHCNFMNNTGYWTRGGAIYFSDFEENDTLKKDRLKVVNCQFENNSGLFGGGAMSIHLYQDSIYTQIRNSIFFNNGAGAQFENGQGGALNLIGQFNIDNCIFDYNRATNGGAIYFFGYGNRINNCFFKENGAMDGGAFGGFAGKSLFLNNTFYNNFAINQGHISSGAIEDSLYNCIFWDNSGLNPSNYFNGGAFYFENCLWKLASCPTISTQWTIIECGPGNIFNQSPRFISPQNGNFSLHRCSPAIDAGADSLLTAWAIDTDIAGNPRVEGPRPDIGAYESPGFRVNFQHQDPACFGVSDGWIVAGIENGVPPYEALWSNDSTGLELSGLDAGIYALTLTDGENCLLQKQLEITSPDSLTAWFRISESGGPGQPGGHILLDSIRGGTPPYTYLWNTGVTVASISGLAPGEYTLTVTDENNCQKIFDFEIVLLSAADDPATGFFAAISPNPSGHHMPARLRIAGWDSQHAEIAILDSSGRKVWEMNLKPPGKTDFDLALPTHLPIGIYSVFIGQPNAPGLTLLWVVVE